MAEVKDQAALSLAFVRRVARIFRLLLGTRLGILVFYAGIVLAVLNSCIVQLLTRNTSKVGEVIVTGTAADWNNLFVRIMFLSLFSLMMNVSISVITYATPFVWRRIVTNHLHQAYFRNYYAMLLLDKRIDNPDQRICEDTNLMCQNMSMFTTPVWMQLTNLITGLYFLARSELANFTMMLTFLAFVFVSFILTTVLLKRVVPYVYQQDKRKGDFRFAHARVRTFLESIAFYGSEEVERVNVTTNLTGLLWAQVKRIWREWPLNFQTVFNQQSPQMLTFLLVGVQVFYSVFPGHDGSQLNEAELNTELSYVTQYFITVTSSMLGILGALSQLGPIVAASINRVAQFLEVMEEIDETDFDIDRVKKRMGHNVTRNADDGALEIELADVEAGTSAGAAGPDRITFDDVSYSTPKGVRLMRNMTWESKPGESILIVGPSGSGRSSILRVLAGLWPLDGGKIDRPNDMFFLPQRPYMTVGTLREQCVYPSTLSSMHARVRTYQLHDILKEVGLGDLPERIGGWDVVCAFDDILSLGEQQRIGLARLLYHEPRTVILDECTASLNHEWTDKFYGRMRRMGVTCISVGHVSRLAKYHEKLLEVDGQGSFSFRDNPEFQTGWELEKPAIMDEVEIETRPRADTEAPRPRSARPKPASAYSKVTFGRLKRLVKLGLQHKIVIIKIFFCTGLVTLMAVLFTFVSRTTASLTQVIVTRDEGQYWGKMTLVLILIFSVSFCQSTLFMTPARIGVSWFRAIVTRLHELYFRRSNAYKLGILEKAVDNAEQRIVVDAQELTTTLIPSGPNPVHFISFFFDGIVNGIVSVVVMLVLLEGAHVEYILAILGPLLLAANILVLLINGPISRYTYARFIAEGDFRKAHTRLREYAESIAFYDGSQVEQFKIVTLFDRVMAMQFKQTIKWSTLSTIVQSLPGLLLPVQILPGIIFVWLHADHAEGDAFYGDVALVTAAAMSLNGTLNQTLKTLNIGAMIGEITRVGELYDHLMRIDGTVYEREGAYVPGPQISCNSVTVQTPTNRVLVKDLNFELEAGQALIIMGPSGVGKSSLLRVIAGLWQPKDGSITKPTNVGSGGIFFLPQRPYMPLGNLRTQVIYPLEDDGETTDEHLRQLLELVELGDLPDRVGGFDAVVPFENVLSLGEQQRVAMARLYYHEPAVALLDEATSALDEEWSRRFYSRLRERNITVVSIGHIQSLVQYHDTLLYIDHDGWKLSPLERS